MKLKIYLHPELLPTQLVTGNIQLTFGRANSKKPEVINLSQHSDDQSPRQNIWSPPVRVTPGKQDKPGWIRG